MTQISLLKRLKARGVFCQYERSFCGMLDVTRRKGRIVCVEFTKPRLGGISFWLHGHGSDWFLGLWSSRLYRVTSAELLPELVSTLLTRLTSGRTPTKLPRGLVREYELELAYSATQTLRAKLS